MSSKIINSVPFVFFLDSRNVPQKYNNFLKSSEGNIDTSLNVDSFLNHFAVVPFSDEEFVISGNVFICSFCCLSPQD